MKIFILLFFLISHIFATPNNPSNLILTPSVNYVILQWKDNSNNETGFKIYRDKKLIAIVNKDITQYIDLGLTPDTKYKYVVKATDDPIKNPIISNIKMPECDINNPHHFFIKTVDDWKHINDSDKKVFCIYPNTYINNENDDQQFIITQSGTSKNPRYILLYNDNNKHPAKLPNDKLAKYLLRFENASNWIVDRQAFIEATKSSGENVLINSSNIIFNRSYFKDTLLTFSIFNHSHNNAILNSYFVKTKWSVDNRRLDDVASIDLVCQNPNESIKNTIIANNEIVNYVDAIQTVRDGNAVSPDAKIDFAGTKILNNLLYVTNTFYSDCHGKSELNGTCSYTENGIDLKGGSYDKKNPIEIKNNIIFGYKYSDNSYSDLDDQGSAVVSHYRVKNLIFSNNLIFDSDYGFVSGGPLDGKVALENATLNNNIFYNFKTHALQFIGSINSIYDGAKNLNIQNNIVVKTYGPLLEIYNSENILVENNSFINSEGFWIPDYEEYPEYENVKNRDLTISNNLFYNTDISIPPYAHSKNNKQIQKSYDLSKLQKDIKLQIYTNNPISRTISFK